MWMNFSYKRIGILLIFVVIVLGAILLSLYIDSFNSDDCIVIELPKGKVKGRVMKTVSGKEFYAFNQIYYAEAPVGPLRFKPPRERKPHEGNLQILNSTVACYQKERYDNNLTGVELTEDCLVVNVFTPIKPNSSHKLLPVLIAVPGGQYLRLFGNKFIPTHFMEHDIVVVSMNYRLGAFGFLSTEDDVIPGNLGLKDQRFAFEWVQDNIMYFNGNASQVTISGNSAGAACVGLHLIGPWTSDKVLFHGAIQGSASPVFNYYNYDAREHAFQLGRLLKPNFISNDSRKLLHVLQEASADNILHAVADEKYAPIIEPSGDFSYNMLESFMSGNFKRVPLLGSFNSEEKINYKFNQTQLGEIDDNITSLLKSNLLTMKNKTLVASMIKRIYTNKTFVEDFPAYIRYLGDDANVNPLIKQGELSSRFVNVYLYEFAYKGKLGGKMDVPFFEGCERVAHSEDLNYIWVTDMGNIEECPETDRLASRRVVRLWANFVKTGNPFPASDSVFGNLSWPSLNPNDTDNIPYLVLNETLEIQTNPKRYQKIRKIIDKYLLPPYIIYTNSDYFS